jgi:PAS domain S-box-containing protein
MTTNTPQAVAGFTRCAVCKIDLKGRFVYIDERTEQLLGYSGEDLLGRPLPDYLDTDSQALIARLLEHRNHYELFFDSADFSVITSQGTRRPVRAVASLNFIAGNPANFQLILQPYDAEQDPPQLALADSHYPKILRDLMAAEDVEDWKHILHLIAPFCCAHLAAVYVIHEDRLEPRSVVGQSTDTDFESQALPETNAIHMRVASTGEPYANTDQQAVQKAIELTGEAPPEFVSRVQIPGRHPLLFRLIFSSTASDFDIRQGTERARLLLEFISRLRSTDESDTVANIEDSIKFTIGFLDSLEIGALLTERQGTILGFNPTLARWLGDNRPEGSFHSFGRLLQAADGNDLVGLFQDYFNSPLNHQEPIDLKLPVRLPDQTTADLTVVRLSFDSDDRSACFALVPHRAPAMPATGSAAGDEQFWVDAVRKLRTAVTQAGNASAEIDTQTAGQPSDTSNSVKLRLDSSLSQARHMLGDLEHMLAVTSQPGRHEDVDLNALIERAMNRLRQDYPDARITCRFEALPVVRSDAGKIEAVLAHLMQAAARSNPKARLKFDIGAECHDGTCLITLTDSNKSLVQKHSISRSDQKTSTVTESLDTSLAVVRRMVDSLGGDISVNSEKNRSTSIQLIFPTPAR